ncbi:hypothetical protein AB1P65_14945 [Roseibium alexandrii]
MSEEFNLPGSSYTEVSKIIQGYASLGKPASLADISKAIGMDRTIISRNVKFLVSIGLLEAGQNKAPTSLGSLLGNALIHDQKDEVRRLWAQVVQDDEFLKSIVSAIRIRKGMDENALKSHIAYSAGAKKNSGTATGCGTVIEVLREAEAVRDEDGKLVAQLSSQPQVSSSEQESQSGSSGLTQEPKAPISVNVPSRASFAQVPIAASTAPGGLTISINIEVACDAADLDTLGKKLRRIVKDLNENTSDEDSGETAD